jgi:hypothetical protein
VPSAFIPGLDCLNSAHSAIADAFRESISIFNRTIQDEVREKNVTQTPRNRHFWAAPFLSRQKQNTKNKVTSIQDEVSVN